MEGEGGEAVPIAVDRRHGTFPVLLGVFANSLADRLELPRGQFRDELASGRGGRSLEDWWPRRHGRDSARRGSTAVRPPRGPDEETIFGRQDRPLLQVGDLEREAARSGPNREDGPGDLLRLGVIGPDVPPSRGSHVEHARAAGLGVRRLPARERHVEGPVMTVAVSSGERVHVCHDPIIGLEASVMVQARSRRVEPPFDLDLQSSSTRPEPLHASSGRQNPDAGFGPRMLRHHAPGVDGDQVRERAAVGRNLGLARFLDGSRVPPGMRRTVGGVEVVQDELLGRRPGLG